MKFIGTFKSLDDDNTYSVTIGGESEIRTINIVDPTDDTVYDPQTDYVIMFDEDPVTITCDRQDLTKRIIISQATINLVSKNNLTSELFANTNRTKPITITKGNDEVFFGYIDPLQFSQGYANHWESIEITATDPLGALQDLKIGNISGYDGDTTKTAYQLITDCLNKIGISSITRYIDHEVYYSLTHTNIKLSIFFGQSEDDWMSLYDTLTEICKYYNLYISYYGGGAKITCTVNFAPVQKTISNFKTLAANDSTSISVDDVYSQINLTCDIEPKPDVITSPTDNDHLYSDFDSYEKYMTEYVATGEGTSAYNGFRELLTTGTTDYHKDDNSYGYALDNFVYVKKNDVWDFGSGGYTSLTYANQYDYLTWLKNNPCKGALIGFGRGEKKNLLNNAPVTSINMKDYLVISVCGNYDDTNAGADTMSSRIYGGNPICTYNGINSQILSPADDSITNYLIISGNILLNPLQPLSGPYWLTDAQKLTNTIADCLAVYNGQWPLNLLGLFGRTVPSSVNSDGQYYQQDWVGSQGIYGYLDNTANQKFEYKYNKYGNSQDDVSKLPILACSLCVGDEPESGETDLRKYCVERLDIGEGGVNLFQWLTLAQCSNLGIQPYFTIGIDPHIGDKLIGQSFQISTNKDYRANLGCNGTAIPIKKNDRLAGKINFKILGPYNTVWSDRTKTEPSFWNHSHLMSSDRVLLQHIQSIMISDLKIEVKSDNGLISAQKTTADNDLVYASDMHPQYIETLDEEVKICTPLTLEECQNWGIKYQTSNSYIFDINNEPFYGFRSDGNVIKPERCLVDYYYIEYCTPAKILETSMKINSFTNGPKGQQLTNEMMRYYITGIYPNDANGAYRIMQYTTSLKYKTIDLKFREYKTYNHTQI